MSAHCILTRDLQKTHHGLTITVHFCCRKSTPTPLQLPARPQVVQSPIVSMEVSAISGVPSTVAMLRGVHRGTDSSSCGSFRKHHEMKYSVTKASVLVASVRASLPSISIVLPQTDALHCTGTSSRRAAESAPAAAVPQFLFPPKLLLFSALRSP